MICGSCLHDNTLARALIELGHDAQLIPLYTPIRTDEPDMTVRRPIFFGGINLYLQQKLPFFRWLPKWLDRGLDRPWLINWASGRSVKIDPHEVGDLAISLLRGTHGFQRKEVERLAAWLAADRPDVIVFSNILTAGCVPEIKRRLNVPIVVTLQGDDIFLRDLPEPYEAQSLAEIRRLAEQIDGFIANTRFYADAMSEYLGLAREKIEIVPLGLDTTDFGISPPQVSNNQGPMTIGYLARLAPEKGLHLLADAFTRLRQMPGTQSARLRIAGWIGEKYRAYADGVLAQLRSAGVPDDAVDLLGEVDRRGKLDFLASLDALSVPTIYHEPKGLFVLEALAAGVPAVQPEHGSFPEMLAELSGGLLHRPEDPQHLAERLHELLTDDARRRQLAEAGRSNVLAKRNSRLMAERTAATLRQFIAGH
jgi:glycosyltransferase involved in cell wall biosynthesis